VLGIGVFSVLAFGMYQILKKDDDPNHQKNIVDMLLKESSLDDIDRTLVKSIKELPNGGCILDGNKKIKIENLLLFQKAIYTHMREKEF
jgi:hypothetical protein